MSSRNGDGSRYSDRMVERIKYLYSPETHHPFKYGSSLLRRVKREAYALGGDDMTVKYVVVSMLKLIQVLEWRIGDQETETHNLDWGLERLYGHVMDLRREVFPLRQEVKRLRSRVSRLEENEAEKAVTEAVEAMEDGEDMEIVFEILGRPEPLNEEVDS